MGKFEGTQKLTPNCAAACKVIIPYAVATSLFTIILGGNTGSNAPYTSKRTNNTPSTIAATPSPITIG